MYLSIKSKSTNGKGEVLSIYYLFVIINGKIAG